VEDHISHHLGWCATALLSGFQGGTLGRTQSKIQWLTSTSRSTEQRCRRCYLLGCDTLRFGKSPLIFQRNILPPSPRVKKYAEQESNKKQAASSLQTLVDSYQTIWFYDAKSWSSLLQEPHI
jgi:hypothetical protein